MASRKMEENLEEQPPAKKSRISEPEEQQRGDVEPTGMNADEQKIKRLRNPKGNSWNYLGSRKGKVDATWMLNYCRTVVYAKKGFPISRELSRKDNYPGTILYYFEVTVFKHHSVDLGLSDKSIACPRYFDDHNYYTDCDNSCFINGNRHDFDLLGSLERNENGTNVQGCGLVMDTNDKLAIFFTFNGKLKGKPISICPSLDCLFPSVRLPNIIIVANFGDDPERKPFVYDINNCPGLGLDCI